MVAPRRTIFLGSFSGMKTYGEGREIISGRKFDKGS